MPDMHRPRPIVATVRIGSVVPVTSSTRNAATPKHMTVIICHGRNFAAITLHEKRPINSETHSREVMICAASAASTPESM